MTTTRCFSRRTLACATALVLLAGCGSDSPTSPGGNTTDADTTDPVIALAVSSRTIHAVGSVTLTATATDDVGVVRVELLKEGLVTAADEEAPWEFEVPFTSADNGLNTYTARAHDAAGNTADSAASTVAVAIDLAIGFVNGDLEDGTNGWTLLDNDPWENGFSADGGHPGGCLRLNGFGSCEANPGAEQTVSGFVPGIAFVIRGDYRPYADAWGSPAAESFVVTVDGVVVGALARGANGTDWTPFAIEFTATAATHTIGIFTEWECDDSSYDVDNLVLELAP